jgi:hypothetical protein
LRRRLRCHRPGGFAVEIELGGQLAIAELPAVGSGDDAVADPERLRGKTEAPGRRLDEEGARLCTGKA